jgi:hypothetical protein
VPVEAAHRFACRRWPAYEAELAPARRVQAGSYAG